jgi:hypothetical protein
MSPHAEGNHFSISSSFSTPDYQNLLPLNILMLGGKPKADARLMKVTNIQYNLLRHRKPIDLGMSVIGMRKFIQVQERLVHLTALDTATS